jgi:hypothetical protein
LGLKLKIGHVSETRSSNSFSKFQKGRDSKREEGKEDLKYLQTDLEP